MTNHNKETSIQEPDLSELLSCSALEVSKQLREANVKYAGELPLFGLSLNGKPETVYALAKMLIESDPPLAKALLAGLCGLAPHRSYAVFADEEVGRHLPTQDMRSVLRDLYNLELTHPETTTYGKLSICRMLLMFGFPDDFYWKDVLERGLAWALELQESIKPDDEYYHEVKWLFLHLAFYAGRDSSICLQALEILKSILVSTKDIYFDIELCAFCEEADHIRRSANFDRDSKSEVYALGYESFMGKVKAYVKEDFDFMMRCLAHGVRSKTVQLRDKAVDLYIEDFPLLAVANPDLAKETLADIVMVAVHECPRTISSVYYPESPSSSQSACKVFARTIGEMAKINPFAALDILDRFERNPGAFAFGPPVPPPFLEKTLEPIYELRADIGNKRNVYEKLKRGIDLRATLKKKGE